MKKKYQKKDLIKIWQQVPVDYYQKGITSNLLQRFWHTEKINTAKMLIRTIKFRKCLDVGCASGYMISEIAKTFPQALYYGVDVYSKAIEYAKNNYPGINFYSAPADNLPFSNKSFDLILCYETIEHVDNPHKCLKEIQRVLKEGGRLVVTMDSGNWLFQIIWFIWEKTKGKVWEGAHLHPFKHSELEQLVLNSGFKIEKKVFSHFGMEVSFVLTI